MTVLRWTAAAGCWVAALVVGTFGFRLPMEAGGLVFGPILLGAATALFVAGVGAVLPRRPRRAPRAGQGVFWDAMVRLRRHVDGS